jgi:hypothetical protein
VNQGNEFSGDDDRSGLLRISFRSKTHWMDLARTCLISDSALRRFSEDKYWIFENRIGIETRGFYRTSLPVINLQRVYFLRPFCELENLSFLIDNCSMARIFPDPLSLSRLMSP